MIYEKQKTSSLANKFWKFSIWVQKETNFRNWESVTEEICRFVFYWLCFLFNLKPKKIRRGKGSRRLTEWGKIRSMTIWEVSKEAKEKGFPETRPSSSSVSPPAMGSSSCMTLSPEVFEGARALDTSRAETLQDRERNSIGSRGVSGGRKTGSDSHVLGTGFSMRKRERERMILGFKVKDVNWLRLIDQCDKWQWE